MRFLATGNTKRRVAACSCMVVCLVDPWKLEAGSQGRWVLRPSPGQRAVNFLIEHTTLDCRSLPVASSPARAGAGPLPCLKLWLIPTADAAREDPRDHPPLPRACS